MDIFVRSIFEEINKIRKNPKEGLRYLEEYLDLINNNVELSSAGRGLDRSLQFGDTTILHESVLINTNLSNKVTYIHDYLNGLIRNRVSIAPMEWDNDRLIQQRII